MAKHLILEERDRIAHLKSRGFAQAAISKALGRSPSVISSEVRRNSEKDGMYYGGMAQPVHSMTFDNGTEFAECDKVAKRHQARLFFARPVCPQQRGTHENMNGLIRQYFPKGTEFNNFSPARIRQVENLINDRPRRCLGYKTPNEVSRQNYAGPDCISDS